MSMCSVFSCVVGRGCLLWPVYFLGKTISLCPASFCTPRSNLPVTPGVSLLPTFAFQSPIMKRTFFWGDFNSDDHYIYYCGQESLRRNGVAIIVNKRVRNAVLGCNLKNERMTSVGFQGKPFNIMVIQVYAPTSNAEEAEVQRFYQDLQDLLELTLKKSYLKGSN